MAELAAVAACVGVFLVNAAPTYASVVDDAYISARYASQLAAGNGLAYNAVGPAVEGYTNLAFVLLLAVGEALGAPMPDLAVHLGATFGALAVVAAYGAARALGAAASGDPATPAPGALVAAFLLASSPHFAVTATNGIESSLYVLTVLCGAWAAAVAPVPVAAGLAAVAPVVRPEGAVVGGLFALVVAARARDGRPLVPVVLVVAALTAWRWVTYGALVPNTLAAKSARSLADQIAFNLEYLRPERAFWALAAVTLVCAPVYLRPTFGRVGLWVAGAFTVALAMRVDMWMPGGRLLMPAFAAACVLVGLAVDDGGWRRGIGVVGAIGLLTASLAHGGVARAYDRAHTVQPGNPAERAARTIAARVRGEWVATRDAGVLAYWVGPHNHVAELHERALTQPHPGGAPLDLASVPPNPGIVVVTAARAKATGFRYPNDRTVLESLTVPYTYLGRVYQHRHRYYDVYARDDLGLEPFPDALVENRAGLAPKKGERPF